MTVFSAQVSRKMPWRSTKERHLICAVRMSDRLVAVWTACDAKG